MAAIPEQLRIPAGIIFEHHILHFRRSLSGQNNRSVSLREADQDEMRVIETNVGIQNEVTVEMFDSLCSHHA